MTIDGGLTLSELVAQVDDVQPSEEAPRSGRCTICASGGSCYPLKGTNGVFSNSFTSDDALSSGDGVCYRCQHMAKAMDYRRYHWVADESGVEVIKKRPRLIERLLDPPGGPWMVQYKDGSDFLTVLNGWIYAQRLNTSREDYRLLVDKQMVDLNREWFGEMIAFGRDLRDREDQPSKRAMKGPVTAGDLSRYDLSFEEARRIDDELTGREDWRIAVQLVE